MKGPVRWGVILGSAVAVLSLVFGLAGHRQAYVDMGFSEHEVADLVAATAATSPVRSAFDGVVGTMATSLVVAAIAGWWFRSED